MGHQQPRKVESQKRKLKEVKFASPSARMKRVQPLERKGEGRVRLEGQTLTVRI